MDWTLGFEAQITAALIVFARLGTALMFLPGFGEVSIPRQHRLALGMILSLGLIAAVPVTLPETPALLALLLAREALVGLYIGVSARILFISLHYLGGMISFVSSLSNAMAQGNTGYEGSTVITSFLLTTGVALIFVTDSHHIMLRGLFASYQVMPAAWVPLGDLAGQMVKMAVKSLYIATLLGAPFFVLGVVLNAALGVANRVMPAMPIFMVAGPLIIMLGIGLLLLVQEPLLRHFTTTFAEFFLTLTP